MEKRKALHIHIWLDGKVSDRPVKLKTVCEPNPKSELTPSAATFHVIFGRHSSFVHKVLNVDDPSDLKESLYLIY